MDQLTQLADDAHRQRLAHAQAQRPAQRLLALARATRRAERAERRAPPCRPPGPAAARPAPGPDRQRPVITRRPPPNPAPATTIRRPP